MNLLLLRPDEVDDRGRTRVDGRRARHLLDVLRVELGRTLLCGLVDGRVGEATVTALAADAVELSCTFAGEPPPPSDDVLLLAVPRPKVLRRCLETAAALGFGTIVLLRSWRVDKSHLQSRATNRDELHTHLLLGLEQSQRTHLPRVLRADRFRPFIEDELDELLPDRAARFVADPGAETDTSELTIARGIPLVLAIGPERGFTNYEVGRFVERGFTAVRSGRSPLRVESALVAISAELRLLRRSG